ncbi:recombinase family protein [Curtobacterium sp. MCBD17_003]|uniref:recombinase family protein n=1 Tax=Curtobacterium sp. MCBD17_003 TaxID=2175667 RepID=UPI000DA84621|nr:recombinase family protein [Curtobacterium sp. MCBD17_003]WIE53432.1 recombinase family protein [Curtobacterium sp. MCBD17_003]
MQLRAAVYLRISNDDRATGLAVERQRQDCLRIVADRGWTLAGEPYTDNGISASKKDVKRPAYERLENDYAAGRFDALVCWDLDRLTRQPRQLEDWIDAAESRGLIVVTANGEADLSTDGGRMYARIKASVARAEIERKGARQRRANVQRVAMGLPVPGRRRYGYESDGTTARPNEAAVILEIFHAVADGRTIYSIAAALTARGTAFTTGRGGEGKWTPGRVRDVILNRSYQGMALALPNDAALTPSERRELRKRAESWQRSEHVAAIVDDDTAETARAILADPARRTTPGPARRYLLSGIAVCGVCGAGIKRLRESYRCSANHRHPQILARYLEPQVRDAVVWAIATGGPDLIPTAEPGTTLATLLARLDRAERAAAQTSADRDEGLISAAVARVRLEQLRDEREVVTAELDRARAERSGASALLAVALDLLGHLPPAAAAVRGGASIRETVGERFDALDLDRQREVVRALVAVQVDPGRGPERVRIQHLLATHLNEWEHTE